MKILGRIAYAVVVAILFLWVLNYTSGLRLTLYIEKNGNAALTEENPNYFFFYSSIPDYHKSTPIFVYDNADYAVRMFEIATTEENGDDLIVAEYAYWMVHIKTGEVSGDYELTLYTALNPETNEPDLRTYTAIQYRGLSLIVAVNDEGSVYVDKADLLSLPFVGFQFKDADGHVLLDAPITISESDFTMADALSSYYETSRELPGELELQAQAIFPNNPQIDTENAYIFWVGLAIFFGVLAIVTYFVFFFRRKHLGRGEPSEPLKQDLERDAEAAKERL